ncbi:Pr6Pr family membrane protein [Chryseobacterium sp. MMS23-Vi53]|uniref:Pr6Pr family membrane protein n=1 Tax=Chryseobacterium sp. MMS23-Vi53 TaxID=3386644 RepID=UPI0039E7D221
MKRILALIFSIIGWFAIIAQFYIMMENRVLPASESVIRFFSYFTILTNIIVASYFTFQIFRNQSKTEKSGILTAITIYITVVGLIYQVLLRFTWNPTGLQKIIDELLHTIIPILVIIYWYLFENKSNLNYKMIPKWAIYPLVYLFYILIRGSFSDFYPYPFVDVTAFGLTKVLINAFWILVFFVGLSMLFIRVGRVLHK